MESRIKQLIREFKETLDLLKEILEDHEQRLRDLEIDVNNIKK